MKALLRRLLLIVALPISLVVVAYLVLRGVGLTGCVCDPVHHGEGAATRPMATPTTAEVRG